jgi:zinc protease
MFKATKNHPEGEFDQLMERAGAHANAATWVDWTYFHQKLPKGNLTLVVGLEADRMEHLTLNASALEAEREVVKNERLGRVDNDPDGQLNELLYRLAFEKHPYGRPTIGWMKDIEAITLEDCLQFYRDYYAPNNATITVVGDVETRELLALIQAHYGHMGPKEVAAEPIAPEPPQQKERRETLSQSISTEKMVIAYRIPEVQHPDHPSLCVLSELLTEGESSLVYQRLVADLELASDIWGWVSSFHDPGLMEFGASMLPGETARDAEKALDELLCEVAAQGITDRALRKTKNGMEAGQLRGLADTAARARGLGEAAVTEKDWKRFFEETKLFLEVTADDVVRVLREYLRAENRTVVHALPDDDTRAQAPG